MTVILALDQGTTSSRAIVFNHDGKIVSTAQQEFPQYYPKPGWVEHNPLEIWGSQRTVAEDALSKANVQPDHVTAIGITNQRETTVVWDKETGDPIHNAIVWQCRRTAEMCERLKAEGFDKPIREKTGLVTDAYFSGTKVAWLLDHVDGAREKARNGQLAFGTVDSWLIWKLTEGRLHITDVTNASRTLLYNIHTNDWDDEILERLNIPRAMLPQVRPSSEVYGETTLLGGSIPIAGIAGDQQAATFGQVCYEPGLSKNTYGTGCFILMNTGKQAISSEAGLLTTIAWQLGSDKPVIYALEGSIFIAGAAVQWLRDELQIIESAPEVEELAGQVDSSDGVYVVPAFVGLGAPHWDQYARGSIFGLTRGSNRSHIARATLESLAFQTYDVLKTMQVEAGLELDALRVDGGATANDLLMQIQADVLGVPVQRPAVTETTALGSAYLAGLATGFWKSTDELVEKWSIDRTFEPSISEEQREEMLAGWQKAVERTKDWAR
jgi:glycerol kinase